MSFDALQVCVVIDPGRMSANRIRVISTGWSAAFLKASESVPRSISLAGRIVIGDELVSRFNPFYGMPRDAAASAREMRSRGDHLIAEKRANRYLADDPSWFRDRLVQAHGLSEDSRTTGQRRLLVVYRQSFNDARGAEARETFGAFRTIRTGGTIAVLVGRQVTGTAHEAANGWPLTRESLQSASEVTEHALELLGRYVSRWSGGREASPSSGTTARGTKTALICNTCASPPLEGLGIGALCDVCHMGQIHAVEVTETPPIPPTPPLPPPRPSSPAKPSFPVPRPSRPETRDAPVPRPRPAPVPVPAPASGDIKPSAESGDFAEELGKAIGSCLSVVFKAFIFLVLVGCVIRAC